jgi:hypothetical protein
MKALRTSAQEHLPVRPPRSAGVDRSPVTKRRAAGVEGNARLTGATGLVVLVLSLLEITTVQLGVRGVLTLHVTVGLLLVAPVALKLSSTTWRMLSYYKGSPSYRRLGPPPPLLRVLSPILGVLTVLLLATGIALILAPVSVRQSVLTVHKVTFYLWLVMIVIHVAAHLAQAVRLAAGDWIVRGATLAGSRSRRVAVVASLLVGAMLVAVVGFSATSYLHP